MAQVYMIECYDKERTCILTSWVKDPESARNVAAFTAWCTEFIVSYDPDPDPDGLPEPEEQWTYKDGSWVGVNVGGEYIGKLVKRNNCWSVDESE